MSASPSQIKLICKLVKSYFKDNGVPKSVANKTTKATMLLKFKCMKLPMNSYQLNYATVSTKRSLSLWNESFSKDLPGLHRRVRVSCRTLLITVTNNVFGVFLHHYLTPKPCKNHLKYIYYGRGLNRMREINYSGNWKISFADYSLTK